MSRNVTATPVGQRGATGRQQSSLRDHLNQRVAPYLKKALTDGLNNDVEFPLQWLGEHLIHLSMIHEGNPDSTGIRTHFKYNHDAPAPPPDAPAEVKTEHHHTENTGMTNGINGTEHQSEPVNGVPHPEPHDQQQQAAGAPGGETFPDVSAAAEATQEDTEMQG